jgi:GNAT superfamily N-acetyltransferase
MFSSPPRIQAFLGECDGVAAGYTFVFETYSSFLALPTLYLEDLFVLPAFRKRKLGYALGHRFLRKIGGKRVETVDFLAEFPVDF